LNKQFQNKDRLLKFEDELDECKKQLAKVQAENSNLNRQLSDRQLFMDAVFESIQEGISILNPDLTIRFANKVMKNWYPQEESLIGKKCFWCYHNQPEPCNPCPAIRCMKTGKTESNVVPGIPGSDIEWVEVFAYPIKDKDAGEGIELVMAEKQVISGIESIADNNIHVSIIGNPVGNELVIEFSQLTGQVSCTVIDLSGKTARSKNIRLQGKKERMHLDVSDLEQGIYILNVISDKGYQKAEKIIKR